MNTSKNKEHFGNVFRQSLFQAPHNDLSCLKKGCETKSVIKEKKKKFTLRKNKENSQIFYPIQHSHKFHRFKKRKRNDVRKNHIYVLCTSNFVGS